MIQAMGLKKRLEHTNCKTAVIGISGGLDSTLALLVTVRAFDLLGKDHKDIAAVTMPGFGTTDRTYDNAVNLIKCLGATLYRGGYQGCCNQTFQGYRSGYRLCMMSPTRMDRHASVHRYLWISPTRKTEWL